jgi:hypothetical protein
MEPRATTPRVAPLYPLSIAIIPVSRASSKKRTRRSPAPIEITRGPPNTDHLRRRHNGRYVLFSDIPNNRIMRYDEATGHLVHGS